MTLLVAGVALVAAGCSGRDRSSARSSTTTTTTTTSPTTTSTLPAGSEEPLPVAWVRQVGGEGDDVIAAVTGRQEEVLGAGTTTGLTAGQRPTAGTTAAFVDSVAAIDGTPRSTVQSPQPLTSTATTISSGARGEVTLACGSTPDLTASPSTGAGGTDTWCAPVAADAALGPVVHEGSDRDDSIAGVSVSRTGPDAYAVGQVGGLFPGAKDPTGGELGGGDAVVSRVDATGAARWVRQFGSVAVDAATSVTTSDDGDAVVGGWTEGRTRGDVSGAVGGRDGWIARMDPFGNQRWMTQFGSAGNDRVLAVAGGGDPRRGTETFVAAGTTDGSIGTATNLGASDAMVSAFDASGRLRWSAQFGSPANDEATGVAVDGSTVYVSGTTAGKIIGGKQISLTPTATPDTGGEPGSTTSSTAPTTTAPTTTAPPTGGGLDGFLAAIDLDTGELRWVAQFGSTGDEHVTGLARTPTGLVVVSGSTTGQLGATPPGGGTDGFMIAFVPPAGGGGAARIV